MKMAMKHWWAVALIVLLAVGATSWSLAQAQSSGTMGKMNKQMEMTKQMMMNRPKAMKKADKSITKQKQKAMKAGKYGCCLKTPCDVCALKMGQCPCGMNAANDKPVCNECKGGWHAGNGAIPGKSADQIQTMPRMSMKM